MAFLLPNAQAGGYAMIIAIPVWQNRVAPLFDTAANLLVIKNEGNNPERDIINVESLTLFQRIDLLKILNVDLFICGGITKAILENIRNKSIKVTPFICGDINPIMNAVLQGKDIKALFSMPGEPEKENE